MSNYYTYIIYSKSANKYDVGSTNDLDRKIKDQNRIKRKFSDKAIPWVLKWKKQFNTRSEAKRIEMEIKSMKSRKFIEELIKTS